jgi:hypothetical protein
MFCRETVRELRRVTAQRADYPRVLFVHQGTAALGREFFAERWPEARAVADPDRELYRAFAIPRASARSLFQLDLWRRVFTNALNRVPSGPVQGDIAQLPGLFLIRDRAIVWEHPFRHSGDHPDWDRLPEIMAGA